MNFFSDHPWTRILVWRKEVLLESIWNVMAHSDAREGKWRGNWRMEWVVSTLHTVSEHGASSITTADAHTSAASSRLNWHPRRFKRTRPFRRWTKSGFCACAITFRMQSTTHITSNYCRLPWRVLRHSIALFPLLLFQSVKSINLKNTCWHKYCKLTEPAKAGSETNGMTQRTIQEICAYL